MREQEWRRGENNTREGAARLAAAAVEGLGRQPKVRTRAPGALRDFHFFDLLYETESTR